MYPEVLSPEAYLRPRPSMQSPNFKMLRIPGIDSKESVPPAYVAWRAGMTILLLLGS
jgi:hypothetical protein